MEENKSIEELTKMKFNEIKALAKEMNLETTGSKDDIVKRVFEANNKSTDEEALQETENDIVIEDQQDTSSEMFEEDATTEDVENDIQIKKSDQMDNSKEVEVDGVVKIIFNGQVRLRRTPYIENDNVVKLEPTGATFRTTKVVENEHGQSFYGLSNGTYVLKDDKLVEFEIQ